MAEEFGYEKLEVWQLGMEVAEACFHIATRLPSENRFDIASQMRRASLSVPSNIAEGYGRETPASFASFIRIARGSAYELRSILSLATKLNLVAAEDSQQLMEMLVTLSKKLSNFAKSLEARIVKEEAAPYGVALVSETAPPTANR